MRHAAIDAPVLLAAGAVCVAAYACVLYQRSLQLRRQQMLADTVLRALEGFVRLRAPPAAA